MPRRPERRPVDAPGAKGAPRPHLDAEPPDPGRIHPYGDRLAAIARDEPDPDLPTWVCTTCGYSWERRGHPAQCPNCAAADSFVRPD